MSDEAGYEPSAGAIYLLGSVPLFVVGGMFLNNTNEDPAVFGTAALLCFAFAVYLLLVGAVARGIQVARRRDRVSSAACAGLQLSGHRRVEGGRSTAPAIARSAAICGRLVSRGLARGR